MKILSLTLALCVVVSFLSLGVDSAKGQESTLTRVLKSEKLRVLCILSTPPFGMRDTGGNPIGYDVDIGKLLAESLRVKVEIIDSVDAANRVAYLIADKADVAIATLAITLERAKTINYTDPYHRDGYLIVVRSEKEKIKTVKDIDIKGFKVGVVTGGPPDIIASKYLKNADMLRYGTVSDVFLALRQNKVEAVIESKSISDYQASLKPGIKVVGEPFTTAYWGFGVRKGDYDWVNYLNIFIRDINISGKNQEIYGKWFGGAKPLKLIPDY